MRIKIFTETDPDLLEDEVNTWLVKNSKSAEVKSVHFSTAQTEGSHPTFSLMIYYHGEEKEGASGSAEPVE